MLEGQPLRLPSSGARCGFTTPRQAEHPAQIEYFNQVPPNEGSDN